MDLHNIRESYNFDSLDTDKVNKDPMVQFGNWFEEYKQLGIKDYNAMAISTVNDGLPESRIVLLKEVRDQGFVFYTNYASAKGKALAKNSNISALFFWREQERQVRITGKVEKIGSTQSKEYFETRPYLSQIGAAASEQSAPIESREALERKFNTFTEQYPEGSAVPMPESWGGYIIRPIKYEFWQGREGRLHDRLIFSRDKEDWTITRIQP
jgi:pyridoxamine 5'-phosphate oxidase